MDIHIRANQVGDVTVLTLEGIVDHITSPKIISSIKDEIASGNTKLVLDLGAVSFMSSAGLRMLLVGMKETRSRNGDIYLVSVQPDVLRILNLSGFGSMLKIYNNLGAVLTNNS